MIFFYPIFEFFSKGFYIGSMKRFIYSRTYNTPREERGLEMFSVAGIAADGRLLLCSSRKESKSFPVNVLNDGDVETCEFLYGKKIIRLRADRFIPRGFKANPAKGLRCIEGEWLTENDAKARIEILDNKFANRPEPKKYHYGFINREGKVVIGPKIEPVGCRDYELDMNDLKSRKNHLALLEENGLPMEKHFSEGLAIVERNGKLGFQDQTGRIVIEPQYDYLANFHNGLAKFGLLLHS